MESIVCRLKCRQEGISNTSLKIIACCAMVIDHVGCSLIWHLYYNICVVDGVLMMGNMIPSKAKALYLLYIFMRGIGRISFPVFSFLLVQGFLHTHCIKKYIWRLFLFAVISEIPFDLAMSGKMIDLEHQNVLWTQLLSLLLMCGFKYFEKYKKRVKQTLYILLIASIIFISILIGSDGKIIGILLVSLFYFFKKRDIKFWTAICLLFILMSIFYFRLEIVGVLGVLITNSYNDKMGNTNKYVFYFFYPFHLLIIGLLLKCFLM